MRKYSVLDNQTLYDWGISIQEAYLFEWFYTLPSWASKIIIEGEVYYFASKNKACSDLPMLTSKVDTMYRYYKKLESNGLIILKKLDSKDYVCLTEKSKKWNSSDRSENNPSKIGNKSEPSRKIIRHIDNTIIDNNKTDSKSIFPSIEKEVLKECLKYFPEDLKPKGVQIVKWENEIERILRIDKVDKDQLIEIVKWARTNDFWKNNFMSILKLRKVNRDGVKYHIFFSQQFKPSLDVGSNNFKYNPQKEAELL